MGSILVDLAGECVMLTPRPHIRRLTEADIPRLATELRPGFVSPTTLVVEKTGSGIEVGWRLIECELPEPYDKEHRYDFDPNEQNQTLLRLRQGTGLQLVAEWQGRLVGVLDVEPVEWNSTAWVWNMMLDQDVRRQGLGRELFKCAVNWARQQGFRALVLETQTNNVPACKFYARMGCELSGIRDTYYTNEDLQRGEVAIFWVYKLV
jgi:ribosomal protein S18 acetylase RimI-like enzyme